MNSQKLLLLLSIALIALMPSCEKETNEPLKINVLMPLSTGNSWTYKGTRLGSSEKIDTMVTSIGEKITIKGQTGFLFPQGEMPHHTVFLGINDAEGNLKSIGGFSDVDTLIVPSIQYKINAAKGEKWEFTSVSVTYNEGTFDQDVLTIECLSTDTLVTTPLGTFHCKLFEHFRNSGDDTFRAFYAENIGLIRSEHYEYDKLFTFSELIKYELK